MTTTVVNEDVFDTVGFFDNKLPAGLSAKLTEAEEIDGEYQMVIQDAGEWLITCKKDNVSCVRQNKVDAETIIRINNTDFQKLINNPQKYSMQMFFARKFSD